MFAKPGAPNAGLARSAIAVTSVRKRHPQSPHNKPKTLPPRRLPRSTTKAYNRKAMANPQLIEQLQERVERLLLRHEELQGAHALLQSQTQLLTQERDQLKSRLHVAKQRVEALMSRLPDTEEPNT